MTEPRAKTADELRFEFLESLRELIDYWLEVKRDTERERMSGLVFSILNLFDGTTMGFPALDLVARQHPDDKQYHIDNGENWIEDGTVINGDSMLHEEWYH